LLPAVLPVGLIILISFVVARTLPFQRSTQILELRTSSPLKTTFFR
jgi:hypothetical protein